MTALPKRGSTFAMTQSTLSSKPSQKSINPATRVNRVAAKLVATALDNAGFTLQPYWYRDLQGNYQLVAKVIPRQDDQR